NAGVLRSISLFLFSLCSLCLCGSLSVAEEPVSFHRQIRPILQQKCQGCHQPAKLKGKLLLTGYEGFATGGKHGPSWMAGKPDESRVLKHLRGEGDFTLMPEKDKPLPPEQI